MSFLVIEFDAKKANLIGHMTVPRVMETILDVIRSRGIKVYEGSPHRRVGVSRYEWRLKLLSPVAQLDLESLKGDLSNKGVYSVHLENC